MHKRFVVLYILTSPNNGELDLISAILLIFYQQKRKENKRNCWFFFCNDLWASMRLLLTVNKILRKQEAVICYYWYQCYSSFCLFATLFCYRALLHFLDHEKFKSKDDFVQNYKNLSSFNENEVQFTLFITCSFTLLAYLNMFFFFLNTR